MTKRLITLDFDGTVSPIEKTIVNNGSSTTEKVKDYSADPEYKVFKRIAFNPAVRNKVLNFLEMLKENAYSDDNDVIWATTWNEMTERFEEKSEGFIPHFDYIDVSPGKAEAILDYAVDNGYDEVHIFEDAIKVKNKLNKLIKKNQKYADVDIVFNKCTIKKGITDKMIRTYAEMLEDPLVSKV